jgi:hypothetical protein
MSGSNSVFFGVISDPQVHGAQLACALNRQKKTQQGRNKLCLGVWPSSKVEFPSPERAKRIAPFQGCSWFY